MSRHLTLLWLGLVLACACLACGPRNSLPRSAPTGTPNWEHAPFTSRVQLVTSGLKNPAYLYAPLDGTSRLFVLEQQGLIRIIQSGHLMEKPFLDLRGRVATVREEALQNMVFAPDFATSGFFYVTYNRSSDGALVLARYRVSKDENVADALSAVQVLVIPFSAPDHNGGQLQFGKDGYLFISVGDGNDPTKTPSEVSQQLNSLWGKILRIDVSTTPYRIPPDNPFVTTPNARPEIWAYGLRNPWRFFSDEGTGFFFISDVGQWQFEEVDVVSTEQGAGKNFGWPRMEGNHCYLPEKNCRGATLTMPVFEYSHSYGCAIVGGVAYHGELLRQLQGSYLFGDFCSGRLWMMQHDPRESWHVQELGAFDFQLTAIAQGQDGNIYLADYGKGNVYRLVVGD